MAERGRRGGVAGVFERLMRGVEPVVVEGDEKGSRGGREGEEGRGSRDGREGKERRGIKGGIEGDDNLGAWVVEGESLC